MLSIILFVIFFQIFSQKNLVFPFKKLTIEYLNKTKSIADFINFHIYTNISMGTPPQIVGHFITKSDRSFYYDNIQLHGHQDKNFDLVQEEIENVLKIYYSTENSASFKEIDDYYGLYSDLYYLYDLNHKEIKINLNYNINPTEKNRKLYGTLDLYYHWDDPDEEYDVYLFSLLKDSNLINNKYFSIIYGDYDLNYTFNYLDDDYSKVLGNLILGEYPHEFDPEKYKEEDQISINGVFSLYINKIEFSNPLLNNSNYSENDIRLTLRLDSEFIKGSYQYITEVNNTFFKELFENNICRIENVSENIYISVESIISCENSDIMKKKLQYFPTLYFKMKNDNLTFLFNYKELFKLHNNRLYFLFYYTKYNSWEIGELFFRKYITSFGYDSKTIIFYKSQVDDINNKTDIIYSNTDPDVDPSENPKDDKPDKNKTLRMALEIAGGVIILAAIGVIIHLVIKLKAHRKKRADELKDDYEYIVN